MVLPHPESHGTPIFVAFPATRFEQANIPTEQRIPQNGIVSYFMNSRVHVGCLKRRDGWKTRSTLHKHLIYLSLSKAFSNTWWTAPKTPAQICCMFNPLFCGWNTWSTTFSSIVFYFSSLPVFILLLLLFFFHIFLFWLLLFLFFLFFVPLVLFCFFTVKQKTEEKNRKIAEQEPFWKV